MGFGRRWSVQYPCTIGVPSDVLGLALCAGHPSPYGQKRMATWKTEKV